MSIIVGFDSKAFKKDMENIAQYSIGFLEGLELGKTEFMHNLAMDTIESLKMFIDSNARTDPKLLSHMYEWYMSGHSDARLYDFTHTVSEGGITISSSFSQSRIVQSGSHEPFYNKAKIMELGESVTIKPKNADALAFVVDGNEVFTKSPVVVRNPGGSAAKGGFEQTINAFFDSYFKQSFMLTTGIAAYLKEPLDYKLNMRSGRDYGKPVGVQTGERWISRAGRTI